MGMKGEESQTFMLDLQSLSGCILHPVVPEGIKKRKKVKETEQSSPVPE